MSSLFTVAEVELARLGLAAVAASEGLDVVVGGLGLGWTARAALEDPRVRSLHIVEAVEAVISWQTRRLLPGSDELVGDPRTVLTCADFFALDAGLERWHAVLLDIDHTPHHLLDDGHADFYTAAGLRRVAEKLHAGGVFALWSDDPPDEPFLAVLREVFATAEAHVVRFANHLTGSTSANTVYVATVPQR
jgi:spermidine synthase